MLLRVAALINPRFAVDTYEHDPQASAEVREILSSQFRSRSAFLEDPLMSLLLYRVKEHIVEKTEPDRDRTLQMRVVLKLLRLSAFARVFARTR